MSRKKFFSLVIILVLFLAACGGGYEAAVNDSDSSIAGFAPMEPAAEETMARQDASTTANGAAFAPGEAGLGDETYSGAKQVQERLIIRTANLSLIVQNTDETIADITHLAEQNGGWVVDSTISQYDEEAKSGGITIRIPAAGFNSAMEALKGLAVEVTYENVSGQDVTEEYVDLEARLANLEATADRVRTFLDEAITVEEALDVNQELSRLEGEIEVIKGRMQYLSQSAAFSTIHVSLIPDIAAQPVQIGGWQPQGVAKEALEALVSTLQVLANGAIWLVVFVLPIALLIGIPVWIVVRLVRRRGHGDNTPAPTAVES